VFEKKDDYHIRRKDLPAGVQT